MHHAITAAKHISLSVGQSLLASVDGAIRFLAYHAGLRLMSVSGKMEVAALDKTIRISSALKIKQVGDTVHIEADEGVEINGGGSYSHFRDGVVEEGTAGEYVVHSNGTGTDGAQSLEVTAVPKTDTQYKSHIKVEKIFRTYGDDEKLLDDESRHYVDLNLHIETSNYKSGEIVQIDIESSNPNGFGKAVSKRVFFIKINDEGKGKEMNIFKNSNLPIDPIA
jgi:type VI secretion system secreted protein VgrG